MVLQRFIEGWAACASPYQAGDGGPVLSGPHIHGIQIVFPPGVQLLYSDAFGTTEWDSSPTWRIVVWDFREERYTGDFELHEPAEIRETDFRQVMALLRLESPYHLGWAESMVGNRVRTLRTQLWWGGISDEELARIRVELHELLLDAEKEFGVQKVRELSA